IYSAIEENNKEKVIEILKSELGIGEKEVKKIRYFVDNLIPINREEVISHLIDEINRFVETKVLKPGSENILRKYLKEIFSENLKRYTCNKSFKLLHDRIKQEERAPSKEEISQLVYECKRNILPFRIYNLFLFITLYAIGYGATFFPSMPDMTIMVYYIFYGASVNIIVAAMNRFGAQVSLQYLYRGLENAPTITSAADAWNEYNSHLMRLWAVFSSIGLIIGILGKVFSDKTGGFSRYFVEGIAFILFLQSFREWFLFYNKLEKRSKMEE
ncbi:hypothetical protein J7L87_00030, partial [bacterium]|nr:hypothetical protein [bacterium]